MEQLSLFDILTGPTKEEESIFTSEVQEELIMSMSQVIVEVHTKGRVGNETDKET